MSKKNKKKTDISWGIGKDLIKIESYLDNRFLRINSFGFST